MTKRHALILFLYSLFFYTDFILRRSCISYSLYPLIIIELGVVVSFRALITFQHQFQLYNSIVLHPKFQVILQSIKMLEYESSLKTARRLEKGIKQNKIR